MNAVYVKVCYLLILLHRVMIKASEMHLIVTG